MASSSPTAAARTALGSVTSCLRRASESNRMKMIWASPVSFWTSLTLRETNSNLDDSMSSWTSWTFWDIRRRHASTSSPVTVSGAVLLPVRASSASKRNNSARVRRSAL